MKKLFTTIFVICIFYSFASAAIIDDAVLWMYDNGLTSKGDQTSFKPNQGLRRDEAAKFFVEFAILLGKTTYVKTDAQCKFSDINESRSDLKTTVVESCKLGLFQGSNGKFKPKNQLTNAQAIAVLVRLISGKETETGLSHRADNYYTRAKSLNLLGDVSMTNKNNLATRGNVGTIIYNGRDFTNTQNTGSSNGSKITDNNTNTNTTTNTNTNVSLILDSIEFDSSYDVPNKNTSDFIHFNAKIKNQGNKSFEGQMFLVCGENGSNGEYPIIDKYSDIITIQANNTNEWKINGSIYYLEKKQDILDMNCILSYIKKGEKYTTADIRRSFALNFSKTLESLGDLIIESISIEKSTDTISLIIKNIGGSTFFTTKQEMPSVNCYNKNNPLGHIYRSIYVDENGSVHSNSISVGGVFTIIHSLDNYFSINNTDGDNSIKCILDEENKFIESNENNNTKSINY